MLMDSLQDLETAEANFWQSSIEKRTRNAFETIEKFWNE